MLPLHRLFTDIKRSLEKKERMILAIDGMSAAGKSSFADMLAKRYTSCLIRMDHFFLRPEQRTPQRLKKPGGNIDYERFLTEISLPLASGKVFSYRPYDCKTQSLVEPVIIEPKPLLIIEGAYSLSPEISGSITYDMTIFMRLDEAEQHLRLKERNAELYTRFVGEWIPMENLYFETFHIPEKCDYIIENNSTVKINGEKNE